MTMVKRPDKNTERLGVGRKLAFYGFAAQSACALLLIITNLVGGGFFEAVGAILGIVTVVGFLAAMGGFFLMYYIRRKQQHFYICILMLAELLVNMLVNNSSIAQVLIGAAYMAMMTWSAIGDKNVKLALITAAGAALYVLTPLAIGFFAMPTAVAAVFSGIASAYCFAAAALYSRTG